MIGNKSEGLLHACISSLRSILPNGFSFFTPRCALSFSSIKDIRSDFFSLDQPFSPRDFKISRRFSILKLL